MRPATFEDVPAVMAVLIALKAKHPEVPLLAEAEEEWARNTIEHAVACGQAVMVFGYFIMYAISASDFSPRRKLYERIAVRISGNAPPTVVPSALEELARQAGCEAIQAGDALSGRMTPYYTDAGYSHLGTVLYKEMPCVAEKSAGTCLTSTG